MDTTTTQEEEEATETKGPPSPASRAQTNPTAPTSSGPAPRILFNQQIKEKKKKQKQKSRKQKPKPKPKRTELDDDRGDIRLREECKPLQQTAVGSSEVMHPFFCWRCDAYKHNSKIIFEWETRDGIKTICSGCYGHLLSLRRTGHVVNKTGTVIAEWQQHSSRSSATATAPTREQPQPHKRKTKKIPKTIYKQRTSHNPNTPEAAPP